MAGEQQATPGKPERIEGPTPQGGAYALVYRRGDGSGEIVEFDDEDRQIFRTYFGPPCFKDPENPGEPIWTDPNQPTDPGRNVDQV